MDLHIVRHADALFWSHSVFSGRTSKHVSQEFRFAILASVDSTSEGALASFV